MNKTKKKKKKGMNKKVKTAFKVHWGPQSRQIIKNETANIQINKQIKQVVIKKSINMILANKFQRKTQWIHNTQIMIQGLTNPVHTIELRRYWRKK